MNMSEAIIQVENLSKHFKVAKTRPGMLGALAGLIRRQYRTIRAVDQVTFSVAPGELVGYLGPNGAGKSTTIKMLAGLLVPTDGKLEVDGRVPWRDRRHYVGDIGAVFGQRTTLWWDLPVIESLQLLKHIYRIQTPQFEDNLKEFRQLLELDPFLEVPVRSLSLGQRMRADLCAALLHQPKLLFLDEPTIGLDVVAKERIRRFIRHVNQQRGVTMVLTTHDLSDVERLCRRVMIIDHGRLLYDGQLEELRSRFGGKRELQVEFSQPYADISIEGAVLFQADGNRAIFRFNRQDVSASTLIGRLSKKYRIRDLTVREPDIESTIRRIYEEKLLD
jgi:ABC-2 type transport system ATP-binding protein